MASSDPTGDMICMIKNACGRRHPRLQLPHSIFKEGVAKVLKAEGYIEDLRVVEDEECPAKKTLHLYLKYDVEGKPVVTDIKRVSKPGCRRFEGVETLPKILDGLGLLILSTSRGIISDRDARKHRVGGELVLKVW